MSPFGIPDAAYRRTAKGNMRSPYRGWLMVACKTDGGYTLWLKTPTDQHCSGENIYATAQEAFARGRVVIDKLEARRMENMKRSAQVTKQGRIKERALKALGLPPSAPVEEWRKAFAGKVRELHPDSGGNYTPERKNELLKVIAANDWLKKFSGFKGRT